MDTVIDPDVQEVMATQTEYAFATHFKNKFGDRFKCVSIKEKNVYYFTDNNLWDNEFEGCSRIREILSNDMLKIYKDHINKFTDFKNKANLNSNTEEYEIFNKQIKVLGELCLKLQKTNDKNNITREILDKIEDINFNKDMNKEKYMLPIKGKKMLNMKTLEITDRTIEHKFNYECDAVFHSNMPEKEEADVKEYFMDLFCQKEKLVQTVLDILKSILTGVRTRYIYFFTGIGCNGKSLLFKLLTMLFQKAMDTIDTNVIIDQKNNSQITTQFEKLDKCRIGYVTELKDDMKLNEAVIKKITGGDAIDLRGLFKTNVTINPTCNLCVLTNEMPEIKIEKAIVDRLIRIPFNNVFQNDSAFEEKMISKKDFVFSYIMKYGVIRDKFELTEEMIEAKNETVEDNTKIDYLQKFIETYFEIVPFVKKEKKNRDTFRDAYNVFLKSYSQPMDKTADKKFTRDIRKYGIGVKEVGGKTFYTGIIEKVASEDEDE
jgi:phage/plasmid-associated DNA primase